MRYRRVGDTRSSASTSPRRPRRFTQPATDGTSRSSIALQHLLAQVGEYETRLAPLRQAERLAGMVHADDVLATICGNQAGVMVMEHRYEQALALAERSVMLQEAHGSGHGLAVALGNLGQICVRLGDLDRAASILHRALELRSPIQFHETTGAVFDTLAQVHMIRGDYETAATSRARQARMAHTGGRRASGRMVGPRASARLALRRGALDQAVALADEILQAGEPPFDSLQATLIAAEALTLADRLPEAEQRLAAVADTIDPKTAPAAWGEYLRLRGSLHAKSGSAADAYHDFAQSAALLDLLGERYQAALSHLALGRLVAQTGARSVAERHLGLAQGVFEQLGARRDSGDTRAAHDLLTVVGTGEYVISPADADDAIVRRIVDAAALPDLLGREPAHGHVEAPPPTRRWCSCGLPGGSDIRPRRGRRRRPGVGQDDGAVGRQRPELRPRRCSSSRSAATSKAPFALVVSPRQSAPVMRRL
jgi:tetratricopeptide (TPR) repeat protein